MTPPEPRPSPLRDLAHDLGGVMTVWTVMCLLENLVVGVGWSAEFAGSWEMAHARYYLTPIAVAVALPLAAVAVAMGRLVAERNERAVSVIAGALAALVAAGVSSGRHMQSPPVRMGFVVSVSALCAVVAFFAVRRAPLERPRLLATLGLAVGTGAWLADGFLLPRLYPAFHAALFGLALAGWATTSLLLRGQRAPRQLALLVLAAAVLAVGWTPRAARALVGDDNLRRVLVEHAPMLGRAVMVASRIAPPPPLDDDTAEAGVTAALIRPKASGPALDWKGRDIVVITIDALRADHVSSYGYGRKTTPNIDRLAARGARFEHAYCPTPHTSYSVTSMMTGKYMRPLLGMGAGEDSETWAGYLRRYGFRTAAFYPPAVFFIDEHRFRRMKAEGLGFEYRKEEFAAPELRRAQIAEYVTNAPQDKPLFLWVHLFEPHEPYVLHPEHRFGGEGSLEAYDSEIATADVEVGMIVDAVEKRRPGAIVVVSADHGEEFGEHGGRYHGTTVYEEQVRVPLVVVAKGVLPSVISVPVQTIDLLPTTLAALDVPQPARIRGRDLGSLLAGRAADGEQGLAFAETDDYTLLARGADRLVCVRKIASCTLFDVRSDPLEARPVADRPERVKELRQLTAAIERENGKLEASALPEALRRGLQGDRDAAEDVATLFDDARVEIRREAARCAFRLRAPVMAPQLRRTLAKDEDAEVRKWSSLALARLGAAGAGEGDPRPASERTPDLLLRDPDARLRFAAALALAEQGDARGEAELVARAESTLVPGSREPGELDDARELLAAFAKLRSRSATPTLLRALEDVRLRPFVVDALGEIGDPRALTPLLATFNVERYVDMRPKEARALQRLGARDALLVPLRRFAGVPDPMTEALEIARESGLLVPGTGGWSAGGSRATTSATEWRAEAQVTVTGSGPARLLVLALRADVSVTARVDGAPVHLAQHGAVWTAEVGELGPSARVEVSSTAGVSAFWVVRRAEEIPPPAPREWQPPPAPAQDGGPPHGGL